MKRENATCGQPVRPVGQQMSACLPFCGLGSEGSVLGKAAACGLLLTAQGSAPAPGEGVDALTRS